MRVAFVTIGDSNDVGQFSGIPFFMAKTFAEMGIEVERVCIPIQSAPFWVKLKHYVYRKYLNKQFLRDRDSRVLRTYEREINKALALVEHDVIFTMGSTTGARLSSKAPLVFWAETTFAETIDFYYRNLCRETIRSGHAAERRTIDRAALMIFPSDWAANSAIDYYGADPEKVRVIPYGANVEAERSRSDIEAIVDERLDDDVCRLLFVGVDWHRKGGNTAVEVVNQLNNEGVRAELTVLGPRWIDPKVLPLPEYVINLGFVDKKSADGRGEIDARFRKSHFMIMPTHADCSPIVIPESNSFGLPCLTTNVGGITTAIRDDINGKTFPDNGDALQYVKYIKDTFADKAKYRTMALASFDEFQTRLNWNVSTTRFKAALAELIN